MIEKFNSKALLATTRILFFVSLGSLLIWSCDSSDTDVDFREQWVGSYEGTKSSTSFEDTMFVTDIAFQVTIDEGADNHLIVNGVSFQVTEDGSFGPDFLDGGSDNYTLRIDGDDLSIERYGIGLPGPVNQCFILATKL